MRDAKPRIGEITAYRAFEVRGAQLWSIGYGDYCWRPGTNEAFCDKVGKSGRARKAWVNDPIDADNLIQTTIPAGDHGRIPSPNCGCGFYAYKSETGARARLNPGLLPGRSTRFGLGHFATDAHEILAKVALWGRVIEGRDGYRAQFARVTALIHEYPAPEDLVPEAPAYLIPVVEHYDIPVLGESTNVVQGYITKTTLPISDGPLQVLIRVVRGVDPGWFMVDPSVELPDGVPEVWVEFEVRDGARWIIALDIVTEVDP